MTAQNADYERAEQAISALWLAERKLGQLGMERQANKVMRIRRRLRNRTPINPLDFIEVERPQISEGSSVLGETGRTRPTDCTEPQRHGSSETTLNDGDDDER